MARSMIIDGRKIGPDGPPYVVAELSGNHNGEIERAFGIIAAAKVAGASAVKLQTYTADTITIDSDRSEFVVDLPLWKNRTLHDLYEEAHTPWDWHEGLFAKGKELGITVFSSPFDPTAVDFLESLGAPAYKIASFELVDIPLIEKVAATGKPVIMSTGMGSLDEIGDAVNAARGAGCRELALLHCVSAYPTPFDQANLANIGVLAERFEVPVGLSDHTMGTVVPVAATALGAAIIEKHVTLSRADGGVDSAFSLEPDELKQLVDDVAIAAETRAGPRFGAKEAEAGSLNYRRSLYVVADIEAGECFTESNVRSIRPGFGLPPKHLKSVLGKTASRALKRGEPLAEDMILDSGKEAGGA